MSSPVVCNNCDKFGHTFHSCRKPLISSGIIAFRKKTNNKPEFLIVCRKHSFGYVDFLRGRYAINNKAHIMDILYEMTNKEKESILSDDFDNIWLNLWGSSENAYYKNEKTFAREKYNMLMKGVFIKNERYNTVSLIKECKTSWETPEWGFPKGRKNQNESGRQCAIREWSEETGFSQENIDIFDNIIPYNEYVIGSNYQAYRDSYFIGKFKGNEEAPIHYEKKEISDAKWASSDEIMSLLRPYHRERIAMLKKIDTILEKWII